MSENDQNEGLRPFDRAIEYLSENGSEKDCLNLVPELMRLRRMVLEANARSNTYKECIMALEGTA